LAAFSYQESKRNTRSLGISVLHPETQKQGLSGEARFAHANSRRSLKPKAGASQHLKLSKIFAIAALGGWAANFAQSPLH
jgi:hypothetical protein